VKYARRIDKKKIIKTSYVKKKNLEKVSNIKNINYQVYSDNINSE